MKRIVKKVGISIFTVLCILNTAFSMVWAKNIENTQTTNNEVSKVLTKADFILDTDDESLKQYDNDVIDVLEATQDQGGYYYCMNLDVPAGNEIGHMILNRNIELGVSTKEELLDKYGTGISIAFNSDTDIVFSGKNYEPELEPYMPDFEKKLTEVIAFNYKSLYQALFFIGEDKIQAIYFLNGIYYNANSETVKVVQEFLNEQGYNCGTPDGIEGGNTKNALLAYQKDNGLYESGIVDDSVLKSMKDKTSATQSTENSAVSSNNIGMSIDTFVARYNEAVDYYNAIANRDGYSTTSYITKDNLQGEEYSPSGNSKICVNPNTTIKDPVGIMNIWIDDTAKIDTNVATGEIMAIIYAIDPSLSSGADALELWGKLNQNSEVQQDGIAFDNYSFGNLVAVKAQYDGFEIQK